jgi:ADP-ribose pyrophosphatase YjhB (NUDIX family)
MQPTTPRPIRLKTTPEGVAAGMMLEISAVAVEVTAVGNVVASVVVIQDGQVLLIRGERYGTWLLPGGLVERGESPAQAAVREVREETGLEVQLTRLVGVFSRPHWRGDGYHVIVFAASMVGGVLQADQDETLEVRFFDPADLPDSLHPMLQPQILAAVAGIGAGIAWVDDTRWPFAENMTQEALDDLRDRSGLSGPEFLHRYFPAPEPVRIEVGWRTALSSQEAWAALPSRTAL